MEFKRLDATFPHEIQSHIHEYALPIHRKPEHGIIMTQLFNIMKRPIIKKYNNIINNNKSPHLVKRTKKVKAIPKCPENFLHDKELGDLFNNPLQYTPYNNLSNVKYVNRINNQLLYYLLKIVKKKLTKKYNNRHNNRHNNRRNIRHNNRHNIRHNIRHNNRHKDKQQRKVNYFKASDVMKIRNTTNELMSKIKLKNSIYLLDERIDEMIQILDNYYETETKVNTYIMEIQLEKMNDKLYINELKIENSKRKRKELKKTHEMIGKTVKYLCSVVSGNYEIVRRSIQQFPKIYYDIEYPKYRIRYEKQIVMNKKTSQRYKYNNQKRILMSHIN